MKIIIAGSREFVDYPYLEECIDKLCLTDGSVVITGKARGADTLGERYAKDNGFEIEEYPADWNTYGKKAGIIRNQEMADNADCLIVFWDGKSSGTKNMITLALKHKLETHVFFY